jgi:hypothetical protein
MPSVATLREHPVWEDLALAEGRAIREQAARALFDDVRPAWEGVTRRPTGVVVADPLLAFALALQAGMRCMFAMALTDDVRDAWDRALEGAPPTG